MGWLLLAPVAALLLVAPPALGSFGVDRSVRISSSGQVFAPLPASAGPHAMTLLEYTERTTDHGGASLRGATVALTGFVAAGSSATSFRLARYQIACCAADAVAAVVKIVGVAGTPPRRDQWLTVVGRFAAPDGETAVLAATSVQQLPPPDDPYEGQ